MAVRNSVNQYDIKNVSGNQNRKEQIVYHNSIH